MSIPTDEEARARLAKLMEALQVGSYSSAPAARPVPAPTIPQAKDDVTLTQYTIKREKTQMGKKSQSGLVQFNIMDGRAFAPATATQKRLDAGVYRVVEMNNQYVFLPHSFPTDQLIRFPDSKSDEVVAEIAKFWEMKPNFDKFGFTHKRGVLLYGPPGTGKTSTIVQIMEKHVENDGLVVLGDTHPAILTQMLQNLREIDPDRRLLVVMEDVEVLARYGSIFTALLDGEKSIGGVVFLATTNYIDQLEQRVKARPSRFDKVIEIGPPPAGARALYLRSRGLSEAEVTAWVALTEGFSFAHLKELVIAVCCFEGELESEAKRLRGMLGLTEPVKKAKYQVRDIEEESADDEDYDE